MNRQSIGAGVVAVILCATAASAQDLTRYREFELGSAVAVVSSLTGVAGSEVKAIHQRPAVIQQLTWRPIYSSRRPDATETESVDRVVFDFYDDRLFRITADYDRQRTQGLNDADIIEAMSRVYGPPVTPAATRRSPPSAIGEESVVTVAQWMGAGHSVTLHRLSAYSISFRLVITADPVAALARTAAARAVVLDAREAPQREAARDKKQADDRRAEDEKARAANKATFRP